MDKNKLAEKVVQKMRTDDAFSRWLGIEVLDIKPGYTKLEMEVRDEMANGFNVSHGGIAFSLADSALAFASNSYGQVAVAMENNISFMKKVLPGDTLTAETEELSIGRRIGVYNISVINQKDEQVALFRGTVFRTQEYHFE
ncbi:phenylacetic acid degradation protein PaaD [Aliifodinibius salipaludis]|uniref:Phenylacetic acid degradation protein PaaD n=1 Tax=Fodinibius salipaludis TaxID=2032627 RepID=A0A2A2GE32_9BACT|nr:hydroxyphenylacetyl-CoA thioesterase PaaI [Aliifodinibius salipaludis]PAU95906.1 phenylacetic acid degradation protein PaaD [Aliifodinibius salipaludis]